jgi:hypothetical protein
MKHTWKTSPYTVIWISVGMVMLIGGVFAHMHLGNETQFLRAALSMQIDEHANNIAVLLSESHRKDHSQIADAVYSELQRPYSTSLIKRDMVSVRQSAKGTLECVIDTKSFGLPVRRILELQPKTSEL